MGWLEDDEMMRQWEDVTNEEEEKITVRKIEGRRLQVEGVQKVLELPVTQVFNAGKGTKEGEEEKQGGGLLHREHGGESKQAGVQRHGGNGAMEEHQSGRHQQCGAVINAMLPRRHCLKEQKRPRNVLSTHLKST